MTYKTWAIIVLPCNWWSSQAPARGRVNTCVQELVTPTSDLNVGYTITSHLTCMIYSSHLTFSWQPILNPTKSVLKFRIIFMYSLAVLFRFMLNPILLQLLFPNGPSVSRFVTVFPQLLKTRSNILFILVSSSTGW